MADKCYSVTIFSPFIYDQILRDIYGSFIVQLEYSGIDYDIRLSSSLSTKDRRVDTMVTVDLFNAPFPDMRIPKMEKGEDRFICISAPSEELPHIRYSVCKQLGNITKDRHRHIYVSEITILNDAPCFQIMLGIGSYNIPEIFPFKNEEEIRRDKNMYRMVIDTDQFNLTTAEALSIASHPESAYVVYNTPAAMGEYRYLGPGGIDKYAYVDISMAFGAVYRIDQIDARADNTDPDEIDARILVVTFDVFDRESLTTQHLKKHPGDFILKPRMMGGKFVCFDLIRTNAYTNYTLIEKSEDGKNEDDSSTSEESD